MKFRLVDEPHPHLVVEEIVDPELYRQLRFPDDRIERSRDWGLTRTDPAYAEVMADPAWARTRAEVTSEATVRAVIDAFAPYMVGAGCRVDPAHAHLVDFVETREQKAQPVLDRHGDPNALFTRFDFQSKAEEYGPFVHLDWDRRIVGSVLFFSDADEEGLVGGELAFYRDAGFKNDRYCHAPEVVARFPARHNTGLIFLNTNASFHGPTTIEHIAGRRRWVNFNISSRVDIWPHARPPGLPRRGMKRLGRRLRAVGRQPERPRA